VDLGRLIGFCVGLRVGVGLGVGVGADVNVAVGVSVRVEVGVGVRVDVGVGDMVGVDDALGVGEQVGKRVSVGIGIDVGVDVGVIVGIVVMVGVGVLVGGGATRYRGVISHSMAACPIGVEANKVTPITVVEALIANIARCERALKADGWGSICPASESIHFCKSVAHLMRSVKRPIRITRTRFFHSFMAESYLLANLSSLSSNLFFSFSRRFLASIKPGFSS
jgi:hypothetical protein